MREVKTSELIGPALDWAVAQALGGERKPYRFASNEDAPMDRAWVFPTGYACTRWAPSTDWGQGGPLIEREQIELEWGGIDGKALWWKASHQDIAGGQLGLAPLIAACRAIVAAKLGDTVQVPDELIEAEVMP